jgi:hypothetical protein
MSSGGMKPANQIGPIGTKAGTAAAYQQVGTLNIIVGRLDFWGRARLINFRNLNV